MVFCVSCIEKSFLCWNADKNQAISFSYDDIMGVVTVEDIYTFYKINSIEGSLTSDMKGGAHFLKMDDHHITLQYIQDTVYTKIQLPSGKFLKDSSGVKTEKDWMNQIRYHAVYPVIWQYDFNKESKKLSFSSFPLENPRSSIKQKFKYDQGRLYPYKVKDLTPAESSSIFQLKEYRTSREHPLCEDESFSTKRVIRTILKLFIFP